MNGQVRNHSKVVKMKKTPCMAQHRHCSPMQIINQREKYMNWSSQREAIFLHSALPQRSRALQSQLHTINSRVNFLRKNRKIINVHLFGPSLDGRERLPIREFRQTITRQYPFIMSSITSSATGVVCRFVGGAVPGLCVGIGCLDCCWAPYPDGSG